MESFCNIFRTKYKIPVLVPSVGKNLLFLKKCLGAFHRVRAVRHCGYNLTEFLGSDIPRRVYAGHAGCAVLARDQIALFICGDISHKTFRVGPDAYGDKYALHRKLRTLICFPGTQGEALNHIVPIDALHHAVPYLSLIHIWLCLRMRLGGIAEDAVAHTDVIFGESPFFQQRLPLLRLKGLTGTVDPRCV